MNPIEVFTTVNSLVKVRNKELPWLAQKIGMTRAGLDRGLKSGKLAYDKIVAISEVLEVSPNLLLGYSAPTQAEKTAKIIDRLDEIEMQILEIKKGIS